MMSQDKNSFPLTKIFLDLREREEIGKEFVGLFDNMS